MALTDSGGTIGPELLPQLLSLAQSASQQLLRREEEEDGLTATTATLAGPAGNSLRRAHTNPEVVPKQLPAALQRARLAENEARAAAELLTEATAPKDEASSAFEELFRQAQKRLKEDPDRTVPTSVKDWVVRRRELEADRIPRLVRDLAGGTPKQQHEALGKLLDTVADSEDRREMVDYDAITPLVYLLQRGSPTSRDKAAAVLGSLAAHPAYRSIVADRVQSHCRTKLLLDLLKTGTHKAKELAAIVLLCWVEKGGNKSIIAAGEGIRPLLEMLKNVASRDFAAEVLAGLADNEDCQEAMVEGGGIRILVELLSSKVKSSTRDLVMEMLQHMTKQHEDQRSRIIQLFVAQLPLQAQQNAAAGALCILAVCPESGSANKDAMIKAKVVRPLVRLLSDGDETGQKRAAEVLRALATDHENKEDIAREGAVMPLVQLLMGGTMVGRHMAERTLRVLADKHDQNKEIIAKVLSQEAAKTAAGKDRRVKALLRFCGRHEEASDGGGSPTEESAGEDSAAEKPRQGEEPRRGKLGMISARFDDGPIEQMMRKVHKQLLDWNFNVLMVDAKLGDDFGKMTAKYLYKLYAEKGIMLCVCTKHYGEKTSSPFNSHEDLRFALDYKIEVVPLKVEEEYPPKPASGADHPYDKDSDADSLIKMVLRRNVHWLDCLSKEKALKSVDWIAREIAKRLLGGQADASAWDIAPISSIPSLVQHLAGGTPEMQKDAVNKLWRMADDKGQEMVQCGAITPLVCLLHDGAPEARDKAAQLLCILAKSNADCNLADEEDAIQGLMEILKERISESSTSRTRDLVLEVFCKLADNSDGRKEIANYCDVDDLLKFLRTRNKKPKELAMELAAVLLHHLYYKRDADKPAIAAAIASKSGIPPLLELMKREIPPEAVTLLVKLSDHKECQAAFVQGDCIAALMEAVLSSKVKTSTRDFSVEILHNLARGSNDCRKAIIPELTQELAGDHKNAAAGALRILATDCQSKVAILNAKAIQPLVRLLCEGDETGKERAAGVLQALSMLDDNGKEDVAKAGAILPLVNLLMEGARVGRHVADGALRTLAELEINRRDILKALSSVTEKDAYGKEVQRALVEDLGGSARAGQAPCGNAKLPGDTPRKGEAIQPPPRRGRLAMISARFDKKSRNIEMTMRSVREKLIERGCDVLMVQARGGQNFGRMTIDYLSRIHREGGVLICACSSTYGEKTASPYSSHGELRYAADYHLDVLPLRLAEKYPPRPPSGATHEFDQEDEAAGLLDFIFRPNISYIDCLTEDMSLKADSWIADEIEKHLLPEGDSTSSGHGDVPRPSGHGDLPRFPAHSDLPRTSGHADVPKPAGLGGGVPRPSGPGDVPIPAGLGGSVPRPAGPGDVPRPPAQPPGAYG